MEKRDYAVGYCTLDG
jgi:folylpolyglutamate synthase